MKRKTPDPSSEPPRKRGGGGGTIRPNASTRSKLAAFAAPSAAVARAVSPDDLEVRPVSPPPAKAAAPVAPPPQAADAAFDLKAIEVRAPVAPASDGSLAIDPRAAPLAREILKDVWGYPEFRLKQEAAIVRLLSGGSAVVVFPTGGGKSLVYQVPALAFEKLDDEAGRPPGVTLVVSPLIALMKDQTQALLSRGVKAATLDSTQSRESVLETHRQLRSGELKLLYCAPERLNNEGFVEMIKGLRIRMVAVDEAHCISEWGHAFRPDYLKVARFVKEVQAERVLCLTATATPKVAEDVLAAFEIPQEGLFRTDTYRPNLHLLAETFESPDDKLPHLIQFLEEHRGSSIVYVATHEQAESTARKLKAAGLPAVFYHAGMANDKRAETQEKFMKSTLDIVVATIAFGMGVDKPDIRNIVHYTLPKSPEGYSQEIGRAGRDGLDSTCLLYLCAADLRQLACFSHADVPSLRSVRQCLTSFFASNPGAQPGDIVEANAYQLSKDTDIRPVTLSLLFAQLELRFSLLRAITAKYSQYQFSPTPSFPTSLAAARSSDALTKALLGPPKKTKWTKVDVDVAARTAGVPRTHAVARLQDWAAQGHIELKPSGVVSRFRVLAPFPGADEIAALAAAVHEQMEAREAENLARVRAVVALLTRADCVANSLARYFGDSVDDMCGNCSYCENGEALAFDAGSNWEAGDGGDGGDGGGGGGTQVDAKMVQDVLDAVGKENWDDARFLARVAYGIVSPRATALKKTLGPGVWGKVFGCAKEAEFERLVRAFGRVCSE
ncbi:P-loop containing nucleoside triphosphate hydrolase protein [Geopyxis carbonaria]|nr:P-loop containing nucleoside triphosphate hydrolase protein [Geopyxis carbonaria]